MALLKTTLSDSNIYQRYKKISGPLTTRDFHLSKDISAYAKLVSNDNIYLAEHAAIVLDRAKKPRKYQSILPKSGILADSHFELEKAGLSDDSRTQRTIVTLEDSLDYILHCICDVPYERVYTALGKDYILLSRALLNYSSSLMGDLNFSRLIGIDSAIDDYLLSILDSIEDPQQAHTELAYKFFKTLFQYAQGYATFLGVFIQMHYKEQKESAFFKSVSSSGVILANYQDLSTGIELTDDYIINIKSYKAGEYPSIVEHIFRGDCK